MNTRKILEEKAWQYTVFETGTTIRLSVPIPQPAPGFDVFYTLNAAEKEHYLEAGIQALEDRIADMKVHYTTYEMVSWR